MSLPESSNATALRHVPLPSNNSVKTDGEYFVIFGSAYCLNI